MAYDKNAVRKLLDSARAAGRTSLTAPEARAICDAYGITVPKEGVATSAAEAARLAAGIGFPVVMKIVSPQILHKTEAGGVVVGISSTAAAEEAYNKIVAKLNGAMVQALADPQVKARFAQLGLDVAAREQQTPAGLAAFQNAEMDKWWPIIKAAGIRGE